MSYTTVSKVESEFQGIDLSDFTSKTKGYITNAERFVTQYDLTIFGQTDSQEDGKLIDYHIDFLKRGVESEALIWQATSDQRRVIENGVLCQASVVTVNRHELSFDTIYGNVSFSSGDCYLVEDVARRELAERYKAASFLYTLLKTANKNAVQGIEAVEADTFSIDYGDTENIANITLSNNPFEQRFRETVGFL